MSWRLGELASWAAAKGVLVWQADVALATLELYAAAIAPDSSALSHTCLGETRRSTACNEPSPTSSPSATASSATTDTAPLSTLVSRGRDHRAVARRPETHSFGGRELGANAHRAHRARRLAQERPDALACWVISHDLGEANGAVEPLLFCLCSERLSTSLLEGAKLYECQAAQARAEDWLSRVMSKRSPPTVMEPLIAPNSLQGWLHSRTREYSVTRSSPIKRRSG